MRKGQERAIARLLAAHSNIAFAEVDELVPPIGVVSNDPYFASQWHLPVMGAPDAWAQSDGEGIIVAVCDTGVNVNHPDLLNQTVPGYNTASNSTDTTDVHGHGTWVSGVVAAAVNNATGVASVAPGARVMAMRITNDPAGWAYFSDMVECVDWAAANGARVANISFGGVPGSSSIADAASRFMRDHGGLVVVAAGNDGTDKLYPVYDAIYVAAATAAATQGELLELRRLRGHRGARRRDLHDGQGRRLRVGERDLVREPEHGGNRRARDGRQSHPGPDGRHGRHQPDGGSADDAGPRRRARSTPWRRCRQRRTTTPSTARRRSPRWRIPAPA